MANHIPIDRFVQVVHSADPKVSPDNLKFYLQNQLFEGVDFSGKRVLDLGAGSGQYGLFAASQGAERVDLLEPESDGSVSGVVARLNRVREELGLDNAVHNAQLLDDFEPSTEYDVVLSHNSINHFNEAACSAMHRDPAALEYYRKAVFQKLQRSTRRNGLLIVADAGRSNIFGLVGARSPLSPSFDWNIHQDASTWERELSQHGFVRVRLRYTSYNSLGHVGKVLMNNRLANFLFYSHFILTMRRV